MNYSFVFIGGKNNLYRFETKSFIIYEISFKPTPYLFDNEISEISKLIFEFSILVFENPNTKLP